ncbi:kinase [Lysinibacillus sp. NPDC097195]|uniref:kinase n=1 Tax=Lysinibacillus sp. NPDC097195 TaxID=3364141 RepID=UPI003829CCD1
MTSKLIIIRGNAGSGKTTTAKLLQEQLGRGTLLVSQDVVRRDMLKVQDREGNLSIELMRQIAEYGKDKCSFVIVEGILYKSLYGDMLKSLIQLYAPMTYSYYFDLSFEETVKRHQTRPQKKDFGEESLRAWWRPHDYLEVAGEIRLSNELSQQDVVNLIMKQLSK